jgi:hypothetical protein
MDSKEDSSLEKEASVSVADVAVAVVTKKHTARAQLEIDALSAWEKDFKELALIFDGIKLKSDTSTSSDENLIKFKGELEKVFQNVISVKSSISQIVDSYDGLCNEFIEIATEDASKDDDDNALKTLSLQIKRAEDMIESGAKREEILKGEIRQIKHEATNLNNTIKQVLYN